ncbi:MAG: DNA-processing protein DprA [Gemmatimonadetes bacterium]|nr:DNA-processing protein DprA [Gemmatimonadota bacterium]
MDTLRGVAGLERRPAWDRLIERGGIEYPERLTHLYAPPDRLWARGPVPLPPDRMIGIVGTRRATEYGRRMAHDLAFDLVAEGWVIVSGLASGVDASAHRGALAAGGTTIAVLGCGVARVYPAANRGLYKSISQRGLLLSEYAPDQTPRKFHFPERNRIIAALSSGVVVVQAGERSGALITAEFALDLGREVLAVPGPADQAVSRGAHHLIRQGAEIAENARDVLRQLGEDPVEMSDPAQGTLFDLSAGSSSADVGGTAARLREALNSGPAHADDLARVTGITLSDTLAALCRLELGGAVRSLPGHRFELAGRP